MEEVPSTRSHQIVLSVDENHSSLVRLIRLTFSFLVLLVPVALSSRCLSPAAAAPSFLIVSPCRSCRWRIQPSRLHHRSSTIPAPWQKQKPSTVGGRR